MTDNNPSRSTDMGRLRFGRTCYFNSRLIAALLLALCSLTAGCRGGDGVDKSGARSGTEASASGTATAGTPAPRPTVDKSVDRVVTADGALTLPVEPQALAFTASGKVEAVLVEAGQSVGMGTPLVKIEAGPLALNVAEAQTSLAQAAAALAKLENGSDAEVNRLEVERAKNQLWSVQSGRDAVCGGRDEVQLKNNELKTKHVVDQTACDQAQANVQAAEQSVKIAEEGIKSSNATAKTDLDAARARVASARLALDEARKNKTGATLTAPFTGTVTTLRVAKGVQVGPGSPVLTLAQTEPLRFATTNLSERNVGDVHIGAPVKITLTAYPEHPLQGTVQRIAEQAAEDATGTVVFTVYADVAADGLPLRAGMTGRVEITVAGEG